MDNQASKFEYDVVFINICVHGGSFHKIIYISEQLNKKGLKSMALFSCEAPLGLQPGIDFDTDKEKSLCEGRVLFCNHSDIKSFINQKKARLFFFDINKSPIIRVLLNDAKRGADVKIAQIGFVFDMFCYYDSHYLFLPHPLTLWFYIKHIKGPYKHILEAVKKIYFVGNLLAEPIGNKWTSTIKNKSDLINKYKLNPDLPICLFLPDRWDGKFSYYGDIVSSVHQASLNLLIKLHPWEYKNVQHGFDNLYGKHTTSADQWGVHAIEEKDASWAMMFSDLIIVVASSVSLEIPFFQKPVIFYSKRNWKTELVKDASIRVNSKSALTRVLLKKEWKSITKLHFSKAMKAVHPYDSAPDGVVQTLIEKILYILSSDPNKNEGYKNELELKNMYAPYLFQTKNWKGSPIKSLKNKIFSFLKSCISK